ncbi:glutamyl-tRNA(Gln) amidotransferase subunit C, chloroplastic/mitochondrial [Andrographis paniculata]|uniref:glutamyl-tRNA(Gln) amidotransferase subunit C, chloroplastic/mitochondrial n=1 Tax=Andrographis paniculata TaxID=175694 RepID=UPI0021E99741|nr:glutamyl-tRNA(Gln) amidotransferase subunit C, chloroplastic/mitochondrial [Andrographis paniculata]
MASIAVQFLSRAVRPPLRRRFIIQRSIFQRAPVMNKRSYSVKSSLEPPDLKKLAETARISLTPQEVEEFAPKIRQVVDWFGQLQDVDLQSVEPALRADTEEDSLREDLPIIFTNRDAMIAAVPTYEDSYIKVPKVLNKE